MIEAIRKDITGTGAKLVKKHSAGADLHLSISHPRRAAKFRKLAVYNDRRKKAGLPPLKASDLPD